MHVIGSDGEDGDVTNGTGIMLGKEWEAVGPFPSGMREQPFMSSPLHAFPPHHHSGLDVDVNFATRSYDTSESEMWPSELADGGRVGWTSFRSNNSDGWLEVSYPSIRWDELRADRGWASLQYSTMLRTDLFIPAVPHRSTTPILIDVIQGVEYAFIPLDEDPALPVTWYNGDIYDSASSPSGAHLAGHTSNFARPISLRTGRYKMLVRAIYEIRMFGDPGPLRPPVIRIKVNMEIDESVRTVQGSGLMPDVVDGSLMGDWGSIAVRVSDGEDPMVVEAEGGCEGLHVYSEKTTIFEGQTRAIALRLKQSRHLSTTDKAVDIRLNISTKGTTRTRKWQAILRHQLGPQRPFRMSFASPVAPSSGPPALVSRALAVPPSDTSENASTSAKLSAVILALHGANVDIESSNLASCLPRTAGWAIMPTGRTEWGEDWHGGSLEDAWRGREALGSILHRLGFEVSEDTLIIGHSNGGQGAWYLASRYPDRVVGVLGAAGYLKIQDYVPYTELTSSHFADPALMGMLGSSLTPYDNGLHLSNLVGIPCLAVHGGEDTNVPPCHSRSYASLISAWSGRRGAVEVVEVKGRDHWWDTVFRESRAIRWAEQVLRGGRRTWCDERREGFTLTCACPDECGGRAGIRIMELETPGRLARLDINARHWREGTKPRTGLDARGTNVKSIEIIATESQGTATYIRRNGAWQPETSESEQPKRARRYGPMIRLLATRGPISIVIPTRIESHRSLAKRLAHDLYVYHRIDVEVVDSQDALDRLATRDLGEGSCIVIGRPEENGFCRWLLDQNSVPCRL